ncbi:MAG: ribonuclease [Oscillospiraceae bacterium]|jgi:hypothetical protein|nr:ribonuclease [Oscillospiraceae bacterium]
MKRKRILLLALLLAFTLTACGLGESAFSTTVIGVWNSLSSDSEAELPVEPETEAEVEAEPELPEEPEAEPEAKPEAEVEPESESESEPEPGPESELLPEDGSYTSKEEVALYLHQYGHLPGNFITKREAEELGWPGGDLEPYAPGKCIGGNRFGNYEGRLPEKEGRSYTECDIDTLGKRSRGAKRLVFSNDGLIYYTEDHYETFELLYGEE